MSPLFRARERLGSEPLRVADGHRGHSGLQGCFWLAVDFTCCDVRTVQVA